MSDGCTHGHVPPTCTACGEELYVRRLLDKIDRLKADLVAARKLHDSETLVKVWQALGMKDGGGRYAWQVVEDLKHDAGALPYMTDEVKRLRLALRNVMRLALRMKRKLPEMTEYADHLLRFCASAGVAPSVLRGEDPASDVGDILHEGET